MKILKFCLVFAAIAMFVFACSENKTANTTTANTNKAAANTTATTQPTATVDELAETKKIYKDKCASCHKEDGSGGKVTIDGTTLNAEDFTTDKMKNMSDEKYIKYIEDGIPDEGMPAFKGKISDAEIKNLVKLIRKDFQGK